MVAEDVFQASSLPPHTGASIRQLADLAPSTLAIMHGSSFVGDGQRALGDLATRYDELIAAKASALR